MLNIFAKYRSTFTNTYLTCRFFYNILLFSKYFSFQIWEKKYYTFKKLFRKIEKKWRFYYFK